MNKLIEKKKEVYKISEPLDDFLGTFDRKIKLPIDYEDLLRFDSATALYDKNGDDTLWTTVGFQPSDRRDIHNSLIEIYAILKSTGDMSLVEHLAVDRIDLCMYGNTKPFRVRIINKLNENHDYFYVKRADASRIYGLELEHILSPNRITYMTWKDTLIEDHIYGIPGDLFIDKYFNEQLNEVRLAKEFVKFNERCFIRLLGDMHASNFVVDITVDFEENMYRIRAIDFDQQCYEGRKNVYLPQFFKENNAIVDLGIKHLTWESVRQYQQEERSLILRRATSASHKLSKLLSILRKDRISPEGNVVSLRDALAKHYDSVEFLKAKSMGDLVIRSLETLKIS